MEGDPSGKHASSSALLTSQEPPRPHSDALLKASQQSKAGAAGGHSCTGSMAKFLGCLDRHPHTRRLSSPHTALVGLPGRCSHHLLDRKEMTQSPDLCCGRTVGRNDSGAGYLVAKSLCAYVLGSMQAWWMLLRLWGQAPDSSLPGREKGRVVGRYESSSQFLKPEGHSLGTPQPPWSCPTLQVAWRVELIVQ